MQRRTFLKHLGIAGAIPLLSRATFSAHAQSAGKAKTTSHKVLSCNVRVDVPDDSKTGDGWEHRRELCGDVIQKQKADLIGLQEAQGKHLSYLKSRMPEYDSFAFSHSVTEFHPVNAILFLRDRYEMIWGGGFWISETPHVQASKSWDSANPRIVNFVDLIERKTGKKFRYWNTHLDHKGQQAREKGAAMIVQSGAALPKEYPQILTGDMNARVNNPAIKTLKAAGWVDTYEQVHGPKDPGFTAHAFKGEKYPAKNEDGSMKGRIDWIFFRGPVKTTSAAVLRDSRNGHYPSDHYFISAEVSF